LRSFFYLLYLWAVAGAMFIGIQVYLLDRKNHVNRIFALLCLSVVCWAFVTAQLYYAIDPESARFWLFFVAFWPLPSSLLLHFALAFTRYDRYLGKAALAVLAYLPAIALILIILFEGGYQLDTVSYWGWSYVDPSQLTEALEPIVLMGMNATGIVLCLIYYLRQANGVRKKQAVLVLIGLSIPMLADVISHGLLKTMDIMLPTLSILGFVIGTGGFTGYASWKYKLFDITPATAADNIIATMPDALLLVDARGDILTVNDSTRTMLEYHSRDLIGRPVGELFINGGADAETGFAGKPAESFRDREAHLVSSQGKIIPVSVSKTSIRDAAGALAGQVLIARDITRRKKAESELNLREEEFKALVEHSPDTIVRFDVERRITFANHVFLTKFNMTAHKVLGKSCTRSGLPEEISGKWDDALQDVLKQGEERNLDYEVRLASGNRIFDARFSPEFGEGERVMSVLMISRDITDRVNAEFSLREAEAIYRLIFNESTDILVHVDHQARIVDVNNRAVEITGMNKEDLVGIRFDTLSSIFTKTSITRMVKAFTEQISGIEVKPYEVELIAGDGRHMFFELSASPLVRDDGFIMGELAILHDVAERILAKEKAAIQSEALAKRGDELAKLYEISSTISTTLEMNQLLDKTLKKITSLKILELEPEAGIFVLEGDRLKLEASTVTSNDFLEVHRDLRLGQCLCGIAAREGDIIVSRNCSYNERHTLSYADMKNHGDIIVPLKTPTGISGVMFLHTEPNMHIREHDLDLLRTIGNQLGIAIENALLYEQTRSLSLHDPLTGLANRNLMNAELEKSMARCRRSGEPLSLVMLDLDHFKIFNDTYGHGAGDDLLVEIARILEYEIREVDMIVRYGGEEFLIIMPDTSTDVAVKAAERIRKLVEIQKFPVGKEKETNLTISLGIATSMDGSESKDILMTRADTALYLAKGRGRNRVERWVELNPGKTF